MVVTLLVTKMHMQKCQKKSDMRDRIARRFCRAFSLRVLLVVVLFDNVGEVVN